ncbi:phage tail fiber protein [Sabulicella glaciei]|uniref:Uncharacterized protein n=1 Tax=Sabulicella glaciei TaxID=2984948 RepID=A0ABT3NW15_9PROT|nr:hypothetical protein [Roseococcus sp. MDT2-1-1]MCW8086345.1 hypothetical protein [Roseococcus sp. MDT2-1-1]
MSNLTDHAKNILTRALCGRSPTLPGAVYLALGTGGSAATGLTGEAVGNGYARQRVVFTGTGSQLNAEAARFTFTAAAGTYTQVGLFDALAGGNPLTVSALVQAAPVAGPGTVTINPGSFTVSGA